jgi:hypothetical protein
MAFRALLLRLRILTRRYAGWTSRGFCEERNSQRLNGSAPLFARPIAILMGTSPSPSSHLRGRMAGWGGASRMMKVVSGSDARFSGQAPLPLNAPRMSVITCVEELPAIVRAFVDKTCFRQV